MAKAQERLSEFEDAVTAERLDLRRIRNMCHGGIPDKPGLRSLYWKILLDYLPLEPEEWEESLTKRRKLYDEFVTELILDTHNSTNTVGADPLGALVDDPLGALGSGGDDSAGIPTSSTPTSPSSTPSAWDTYFKDNDVIEQIDKDVKRLCPEFAFFQGETSKPRPQGVQPLHHRVSNRCLATESIGLSKSGATKVTKRDSETSAASPLTNPEAEYHWEVIERILFIYAKLNPGIGYVQGMNEICGPLYYIMASNPDDAWQEHAEADTYWCFMMLMSEFRDNFIKTLDDSSCGIGALMVRFGEVLNAYDAEVFESLTAKGIKPMFYGFRWLTCLLSQEFALPDVIRLWDSLFSKQNRQDYLICICCSLVCSVRTEIVEGEFADNVKLLQHLPPSDANVILAIADKINANNTHARGSASALGPSLVGGATAVGGSHEHANGDEGVAASPRAPGPGARAKSGTLKERLTPTRLSAFLTKKRSGGSGSKSQENLKS
eukprot:m.417514 g.417514  ORF g.417514 m.417514 type:complete len:493 (+) comp21287_c0_seq1:145-1623(+)